MVDTRLGYAISGDITIDCHIYFFTRVIARTLGDACTGVFEVTRLLEEAA
ncbi:MAG TPA: hypothetical protein VF182_13695 [Candidatus Binatia bacterium]